MHDTTGAATRECPYCREVIRLDAIKCRYCASALIPTVPRGAPEEDQKDGEPGHITYILDKDLIRFGKVAAASLSLIVVVGAALTGLDLKNAVSDASSAARDANSKLEAIKKTETQVTDTKKDLDAQQAALKAEVAEMKRDIIEIQAALPAAREISATYKAQTAPGSVTPERTKPAADAVGFQTSFTVPEVTRLYNFPQNLNGDGQTIGIIELGGGYRISDLQYFFAALKLPVPQINSVSVDGAQNTPGNANGADSQVDLDIEISGAVAPKAHLTVYFAPNVDKGFVDAVRTATTDKSHPPGILLIGWGGPEKGWTAGGLQALDSALHDAANRGITVVVAAGDSGATDGTAERAVDFPASSPWVLSVGGTRLNVRQNKLVSEVAWNELSLGEGATGGGVSTVFPQPDWQLKAHIPPLFGHTGRGVPDVSANADPSTGYSVRVDGQSLVIGGTTAASPLWAGLVALLNQGTGRPLGYLNPVLYLTVGPSGSFNDITEGTNSIDQVTGCKAGPGWDYCTGWGSPNGLKILEAFRNIKP